VLNDGGEADLDLGNYERYVLLYMGVETETHGLFCCVDTLELPLEGITTSQPERSTSM
jgi:hypothetical protein